MYQACLFDYGNTLVEFDRPQMARLVEGLAAELTRRFAPVSGERILGAMNRLYELPRQGNPPSYRELSPIEEMGLLLEDLYGPDRRSEAEVCEADAALQAIFLATVAMDPRDRNLLERIALRMPLGLVSNYPCGKSLRQSLRAVGIDGLFKTIVISGEVGFVKPHPRIFEEALAGLGVDRAGVLFVGDRWEADLCGARDAGLRSCHMLGYTSETDFEDRYLVYRPDHQARSLREVAEILGVD